MVPYEDDEVTRMNQDSLDAVMYEKIRDWTMAELREYILSSAVGETELHALGRGLTAEVIAGVCKLMGNLDLVYAAGKLRVTATCNTTIGRRGTLATRLQPNHATKTMCGGDHSISVRGVELWLWGCALGAEPG